MNTTQTTERPTRAGQAVRTVDGRIGITTDAPAKRTPTIAVMMLGASYSVREQLDRLQVITIKASA